MRDVYDAVADPARRRIMDLLAQEEDMPLHALTAVSKHMAVLMEAGLVQDREVGRETRYRLNPAPCGRFSSGYRFMSTSGFDGCVVSTAARFV